MDEIARLGRALAAPGAPSSDFDLNPDVVLPPERRLVPAAVLVPVWASPDRGARLILTKRASHLKHHPGQVAFPGGRLDAGDDGPVAAALREASEEIGLEPARVQVLGQLPRHETVTGYTVTPVVGVITGPFDPRPEPGEVDEVFDVPLCHVLAPEHYTIQSRIWRGRPRYYFTVPYGSYYIWGATARILRGLAERVTGR